MPHKREPGGPTFAYGDKNKYEICEITGCWIWWGAWSKETRRGRMRDDDGKLIFPHQYFWQKKYGRKVPKGKMLAHTCENSICCNPSHMFLAESHENCPINQWHSEYLRSLSDIPF